MPIDNAGEPSMAGTTEVPPWLQMILKLQQQQMADMHVSQQRQYEEIQCQLSHAPAYFNASDLALYPSWRLDMLAKLNIDRDTIGSLINQGWYINSQLRDRAKQKFHPWIKACEPALRTPDNIIKHLDVLFKNTAAQQKALDWLQSTRQRNTPLMTFISDFDTKILEAGDQWWEN
ncbi:hypothetical protein EMCG_00646 [[Emmonsia] crescens]|uniref:Retrotransposon gag domain-containing protein n=1 Tax=[Emmonsia] crescens TaxID=73230 RepID=A0A0G2HSC9_9EURO|nr:hypothetical protein EMCG_00646 [Emmonsia crescens UAMH 3008]